MPTLPNATFPNGGAGWAINQAAAHLLLPHLPHYTSLSSSRGLSPSTPHFTAETSFADDLYWGIFLSNHGIATSRADGWSGAPVDGRGGVGLCQDLEGLEYSALNFPIGQDAVIGRWECLVGRGSEVDVGGEDAMGSVWGASLVFALTPLRFYGFQVVCMPNTCVALPCRE